jgi:hypothetical protein
MARRSKKSDPDKLCKDLITELEGLSIYLPTNDMKAKVTALVNANYLIRDLGSSLVSDAASQSARDRILFYLKQNVGNVVHGDELMVVSGISEYARRIRELRIEHGWQIISGATLKDINDDEGGEAPAKLKPDEYILLSAKQDVFAAHRWKIAKELRGNKGLSTRNKIIEYFRRNVNQPVTGEELKYLAGDKTEWARRVRELRTEHGWPIITKATGRPDLPVGVYVLEEDRQALAHDRQIKDAVRRAVLMRDAYKCQDCGWNRDLWNKDDPRHLEVHHLIMHADGGENTVENLIALCNICHDVRHSNAK